LKDAGLLRIVVLWVHALSGLVWTGSCASFVLAGSALTPGTDEWREFGMKAAPRLDRVNLVAALILVASGGLSLEIVGEARHFSFSRAFVTVLSLKVGLLLAMALALRASRRAEMVMLHDPARAMSSMMKLSGLGAVAGTIALGLGLWLLGA